MIKALSLLVFWSLSSGVISAEVSDQAWNRAGWLNLLHAESAGKKQWESRVDSANFFLNQSGGFDPKREFELMLAAVEQQDSRQICRFPLRAVYVSTYSPVRLTIESVLSECSELNQWYQQFPNETASMVFAASYINNPSSAFGHLLLSLGNSSLPFSLNKGINYAAKTSREEGVFGYMYKGLTGEYSGQYTIEPLYIKLREYSVKEGRELWHYRLNLSTEQIRRIVLHLWELRRAIFKYYFLDENCGYHLLALLQTANPEVELTKNFNHLALPIETLKILDEKGFIKDYRHIPSNQQEFSNLISDLTKSELEDIKSFLKSQVDHELESRINSKINAGSIWEALRIKLQSELLNGNISLADAQNKLSSVHRNLIKRPLKGKKIVKKRVPPHLSHAPQKISIGIKRIELLKEYKTISYRPLFHSDTDPASGIVAGASIEFLDLQILVDGNKVSLERFKLISLSSINTEANSLDNVGWRFGITRNRRYWGEFSGLDSEVHFMLGKTFTEGDFSSYYMVGYQYRAADWYQNDHISGARFDLGVTMNSPNWVLKGNYEYLSSLTGESENQKSIQFTASRALGVNWAIQFDGKIEKRNEISGKSIGVSINHYF